jgi:hypothetical protein
MGFSLAIKRSLGKIPGRQNLIVQKVTTDIHRGVVLKTPVDEGSTRASWNVGKNNVDTNVVEDSVELSPQEATQTTMDKAKKIISNIVGGDTIYVSNNKKNAPILEYGLFPNPPKKGSYVPKGKTKHGKTGPGYYKFSEGGFSKQAPQGMVGITVAGFPGIVNDAVDEARRKNP